MYTHANEDSVRIILEYQNLPLQVEDKINAVNALPLDVCEFLVIIIICGVKTHLVSVNHHSDIAVCSVTPLLLNPVIMVSDQNLYTDHFRIPSKCFICPMTVKTS